MRPRLKRGNAQGPGRWQSWPTIGRHTRASRQHPPYPSTRKRPPRSGTFIGSGCCPLTAFAEERSVVAGLKVVPPLRS
jgi:hypothetical protein